MRQLSESARTPGSKNLVKNKLSMEFTIEKRADQIVLISLKGRLIAEYETLPLAEQIEDLEEEGFTRWIFNLEHLEYMNSTGLNFLLKILTRARRMDGEVVLCALNNLLETLIVTTKLNAFFTITPDIESALQYFEKEHIQE